jgi:lysosomal Pro-X carboxypeptidase
MHLLFLLALLFASSATTRVAESRAAFSLFNNNRGGAVSLIRDDGNDDSMSILRPAGSRTRSKFVTRLFIDEKEDGGEKQRVSRCEEKYIEQPLSHFAWGEGEGNEEGKSSFRTRYFVCSEYYRKDSPIFFYTGNEANVESYLENTGLMWENAEHFNALLVFAEHRYYGKSSPMTSGEKEDDDNDNDADERNTLKHLNSMEALADYASLVRKLREEYEDAVAVIAFGGSYGGMLASWMRMKYAHVVDGAIAASAPIYAFDGEDPPVDPNAFARGSTYTALVSGHGAECPKRIQDAFTLLIESGDENDKIYLDVLKHTFRACDDIESPYEVAEWAQSALDYIAMGDYPVESGYMLSGKGRLPAWPMKVVCDAMMVDDKNSNSSLAVLENLREAVSIYYNATKTEQCFTIGDPSPNNDTKATEDLWGYQYCSEMFMPMETSGGENDMYWSSPWNETNEFRYCRDAYGVQPRPYFAQETYGGRKMVENFASNIVFSNGMLDPWHLLGVLETSNPRVVLVKIDEGAHHNDLMFSSKDDPASVNCARLAEVKEIQRWVDEARKKKREKKKKKDKKEEE